MPISLVAQNLYFVVLNMYSSIIARPTKSKSNDSKCHNLEEQLNLIHLLT